VDSLTVPRFGRRRFWIILTQLMMMATLLVAMRVDFAHQLKLFTMVVFIHNMFGATQDVAIDSLAVNVLPENERGTANGFMFSGAYIGQATGCCSSRRGSGFRTRSTSCAAGSRA
jgi:PAT family beta-lactamase induction signal transducer AmpG